MRLYLSKFYRDYVWLIFIAILVIKLFLFNYLININPFAKPITKSIFVSIPCTALICQAFALLLKNRARYFYQLMLNLFISLLIFSDVLYIRYFGEPLSFWTFQQAGNLPWALKSIMAFAKPYELLIFADIPILLFSALKYYQKRFLPNAGFFIVCFIFGIAGCSIKPITQQIRYHKLFRPYYFMGDLFIYNPIGYHAIETIKGFFEYSRHTLSSDEKHKIINWFELKKSLLTQDSSYTQLKNIGKGKNFICIQIESMGGFPINRSYRNKEITPYINKLLAHAIYFNNYYYQNWGGGSCDAEFITLCSLYPVRKGAVFSRFPDNSFNSLPILLQRNGYETIAIHDNVPTFWNRAAAYRSIGIHRFVDGRAINLIGRISALSSDENLFRISVKILHDAPKPFFALIITIDSHLAESWLTKGIYDYFSAMSKVDACIGQFIDSLKNNGLLYSSIIVIYGDHGPPLDFEKILKKEPEISWINEKKTVPFIIYSPSLSSVSLTKTAGQIDALPTLAYIMGIDTSTFINLAMGRNIFVTKESFVNVNGRCLIDNDKKDAFFAQWVADGPFIADLIITSNYFKQSH